MYYVEICSHTCRTVIALYYVPHPGLCIPGSYNYSVSQKQLALTFVHYFDKYWLIFKILLLLYSPRNLQRNPWRISNHTLKYVTALPCEMQKTITGEILLHLTQ